MNEVKRRSCLSAGILEKISIILADNKVLSHSDINRFLLQADLEPQPKTLSKRDRLFKAFADFQNKNQCSNHILKFIQLVVSPNRYVNNVDEFESLRASINQQLAFVGYELSENGNYRQVQKANTISEAQQRTNNLKKKLEDRNAHKELFKYCTADFLQNDYFGSVFEAHKGLFQRIREISGVQTDGDTLIQSVFSDKNPILLINDWLSSSEKSEHRGFCNLLKGLCSMFRNPAAHEPKIHWEISEQDALDILGIISYCHRRLDKAQQIRLP